MPKIGSIAPDFSLPNQDGEVINLEDLRGKKVILFVFPKANTSGCNAQACGFRDSFPQIETSDAVVLGISADTQEELRAWKDQFNLPYDLLSDVDHTMLEAWEAWDTVSFKERTFDAPVRSFWVIDGDGKIVDGQVRITPDDSVKRALAAIGTED